MASTTSVSPSKAAIWEDFIDIFYAPSQVFRRREQGSPVIPIVIIALLVGTIFFLNSGALRPIFDAEFDRQMAAQMRSDPRITPEVIDRMRSVVHRVGQVGLFLYVPIAAAGIGLATWLAGKIVDARQSLRAAFVVGAYALAPRVLEGVVNGIQGLVLDPSQMDGRFRITFGPGRLLDPDTVSPLLIALVGRLDVFTIWITVLIAIGLSVTGRIPIARAAVAAAIVWMAGGLPLIFQAIGAM
jgi:hypothetical protein